MTRTGVCYNATWAPHYWAKHISRTFSREKYLVSYRSSGIDSDFELFSEVGHSVLVTSV